MSKGVFTVISNASRIRDEFIDLSLPGFPLVTRAYDIAVLVASQNDDRILKYVGTQYAHMYSNSQAFSTSQKIQQCSGYRHKTTILNFWGVGRHSLICITLHFEPEKEYLLLSTYILYCWRTWESNWLRHKMIELGLTSVKNQPTNQPTVHSQNKISLWAGEVNKN